MNVVQSNEPAPIEALARVGLYNRIGSGSGVDAAVGENLNGAGSFLGLQRMTEAGEARLGSSTRAGTYMQIPGRPGYSPLLTQAEAEQRYGVRGFLDFHDHPNGIREAEAKIWHDAAMERAQRADALSRADNSLLARGERGVAGLLATALDPVNLGLSLVPGVGEARYAWLAERLGAPLARVTAGAVDGAVGNALGEPLALLEAHSEQLDYTAYDSLKSILLGGVLGGGLHLMFGHAGTALSDGETHLQGMTGGPEDRPIREDFTDPQSSVMAAIDALHPDQRAILMRGALDNTEEGRPADVGQLVKAGRDGELEKVLTRPGSPGRDFRGPPLDTAPTPYDRPSTGQEPVEDVPSPGHTQETSKLSHSEGRADSTAEGIGGEPANFNQPPEAEFSTGSDNTANSASGQVARSEETRLPHRDDGLAESLHDTIARKRSQYLDPRDAAVSAKADEVLAVAAPKTPVERVTALERDVFGREPGAEASMSGGDMPSPQGAVRGGDGNAHGDAGGSEHSAVSDVPPEPQLMQFSWIYGKRYTTNKTLRKEWEKLYKKKWPRDFLGRNYDVQHIIALADGGLDHVSNIEPMQREAHMLHHLMHGDFARWAKRTISWRLMKKGDVGWTPLR